MESFFPDTITHYLGNPIREVIISGMIDEKEAKTKLGLDPEKLCVLSVGGSLGSKTLNETWLKNLEHLKEKNIQLVWQTGKLQFEEIFNSQNQNPESHLLIKEFISDMALAYSAADIIVSRAGAIAISELAVAGKPLILVPFPFAAEDHQTKNALSLVDENAARMVKDRDMPEHFWNVLLELIDDPGSRAGMANNLKIMAKPTAAEDIVNEILKLILK